MLGITVGPIAGGFVAEAVGLQAPFFLVAGLAGTAGVWSYTSVQETAGSETHQRGKTRLPLRDRLRLVVRNRNLLLVSLMTFNMFFMLVGTRQSVLPLLVSDRVDVGVGTVGLVLGVVSLSNLLSIAPASYLSGRIGRKPVIVGSGIISGLSLALFAASGSLTAFIVAATVMGVGTGLASPSTATTPRT
jgi:DHA1 family multidrug resistance protein-like MFS transporter